MTGTVESPSPAYINAFRISAVTDRLLAHIRGEPNRENPEFFNLCLSLARGIDYAVANGDIPVGAPDLPFLIKQVCQRKQEPKLLAAIMVLMISVKSACSSGWFDEKEKEELYLLSDEMQASFCSVDVKDMNSKMRNKETTFHPTISQIMSRYYPGMKMGDILCLVEAMPGYDSYVTDIHISKRARASTNDKIYLFVAQIDNIDTSSCIISPQQVNFLLNGEGVERRTVIFRDPGPQVPTPVTHMLKYGSNLLQVVGQFNGKYIIVIAFMSVVSNPITPTIQDYVPLPAAAPDSDNEIVEGPSRISLKCPISFSRIKIPVKGHACKHLQCFDYNNYVGINTRRPQWRCPHCSQSVCFHDIRIDQSMVKVLKEVGEDISHVKISSDGSWEAVTESNENTEKPNDTNAPPVHQESGTHSDIMDLTEGDNIEIDDDDKPSVNNNNNVHKNIAPHMEEGFWQDYYSSSLPTRVADVAPGIHTFNSMPSQNQSQSQSQMLGQNENVHARFPSHVLNVTRASNAVQGLPAQHSITTEADRRQHLITTEADRRQHNSSRHRNHIQLPNMYNNQGPQQVNGGGRHTSPLPPQDHFRSHLPPSLNQRGMGPGPVPVRPAPLPVRHPGGVGPTPMTSHNQSHYSLADIQRATRPPSTPPPIQTPAPSIPLPSTGDQRDASTDADWRPSGRMRGSLSGRAYSEALNQFIIHPNQPVQAARPPVLNTPRPFIPPHLQALMPNNLRPQSGTDSDGGVLPDK